MVSAQSLVSVARPKRIAQDPAHVPVSALASLSVGETFVPDLL